MPEIIKEGYLSLKEEGLRAWIWSKRYCVLRDQSLTFHRNEVYFIYTSTIKNTKYSLFLLGWSMYWFIIFKRNWISNKDRFEAILL